MEEQREIEITTQALPIHDVVTHDTATIEMGSIFVDSAAIPEQVNVGPGFALSITARQDAKIERVGALGINVGRNVDITYGGGIAINAGHSANVKFGGAMLMNAGGSVDIDGGGAWAINAAKGAEIKNSFVGVLISPKTDLGEGTHVILNTRQAIAFGAAFGLVFTLLRWLMKR